MTRYIKRTTCVAGLVLSLALVSHPGGGYAEETIYLSPDDLISRLETGNIDYIIEGMNDIKAMHYQGQILPLILTMWRQEVDEHPNLPWKTINLPVIRVELADIIVQAFWNGLVRIEKSERDKLHEFVASLAESADLSVAGQAIFVLSIMNDEADVDLILGIAKQTEPHTFRYAVRALAFMCSAKAGEALDDLEKYLTDADARNYILTTRQDSQEIKEMNGGAWCSKDPF